MDYRFETDHFRLTSTELHLLRSRYAFKKVPIDKITGVFIGKGISVNRPILVFCFGLLLTLGSLYVLLFSSGLFQNIFTDHTTVTSYQATKFLAGLLIAMGFLFIMGAISIYQAIVKTWVMRVEYSNGKSDVFSLKKLVVQNKYFELEKFVLQNFKSAKIDID